MFDDDSYTPKPDFGAWEDARAAHSLAARAVAQLQRCNAGAAWRAAVELERAARALAATLRHVNDCDLAVAKQIRESGRHKAVPR